MAFETQRPTPNAQRPNAQRPTHNAQRNASTSQRPSPLHVVVFRLKDVQGACEDGKRDHTVERV